MKTGTWLSKVTTVCHQSWNSPGREGLQTVGLNTLQIRAALPHYSVPLAVGLSEPPEVNVIIPRISCIERTRQFYPLSSRTACGLLLIPNAVDFDGVICAHCADVTLCRVEKLSRNARRYLGGYVEDVVVELLASEHVCWVLACMSSRG